MVSPATRPQASPGDDGRRLDAIRWVRGGIDRGYGNQEMDRNSHRSIDGLLAFLKTGQ